MAGGAVRLVRGRIRQFGQTLCRCVRFDAANQISARVKREAIAVLAGREARWSHREPVSDAYSVVNLLPWARTDVVELRLPSELRGAITRSDVSAFIVELLATGRGLSKEFDLANDENTTISEATAAL